ncbi:MAG TPA: zinc ribbon domain-containing protein [Anaerolineales bacterium]|nr:zinc ribbon domain-containing protein [Anaerolineales bacterium]
MTQKELGYVELEWTCKRCGTVNPGMKRVCTNCGAPIEKDDQFELPDQQVLITDQQKLDEAKSGPAIQCPYCNVLNPAGTKLCIQCGGDIQEGLARKAGEVLGAYQSAAVPDKPCPSCGQLVKANAERCPFCGGSLAEAPTVITPAVPATPKKTPLWMIAGGIALGVLCLAAIIAAIVLSNRTQAVTATVSDLRWQRSIEILALQPAQRAAWEGDVPAEAQSVSCRDEYKETSSFAVPKSTEVCGTPYTVDTGSGAGKVVQDCEYQVYASYCEFTVQELAVVNVAEALGSDNPPVWPATSLQAGQQEGNRFEKYHVTFSADGTTYTYDTVDLAEFNQFSLGSQWLLDINTFGDIKEIRSR